jgi:hypothetical protein
LAAPCRVLVDGGKTGMIAGAQPAPRPAEPPPDIPLEPARRREGQPYFGFGASSTRGPVNAEGPLPRVERAWERRKRR